LKRLLKHTLLAVLLCATTSAQDPGTIITIAGGGSDLLGTGISATDAQLNVPQDIAIDAVGDLYIADTFSHIIRKINIVTGEITTIAGTGTPGFEGDGGPATEAELNFPRAIAIGTQGEIIIADSQNYRVRRIDPQTGLISTLAGLGIRGTPPQVGSVVADSARFGEIVSILTVGDNAYLFGDGLGLGTGEGNNQILQFFQDSIIVIAGTGNQTDTGDGGNALNAGLSIEGMGTLPGRVIFADAQNHVIRSLESATNDDGDPFTLIERVAGNGVTNPFTGFGTFSGDGGPALDAGLDLPLGVIGATDGRIYIMDGINHRVRSVEPDGSIITVAGSSPGNDEFGNFSGDGGLAINAELAQPYRGVLDLNGDLIFIDNGNNRIRKIFQPDFRTSFLTASATSFNYGAVSLGLGAGRTLTLANLGNRSLTVTSITIDNPLFSTDFQFPTNVNVNQSRTLDIRFSPVNESPETGTMVILTTDPFLPRIEIPLSGSGIVPDIDALPKSLVFEPTFTDETRQLRVRVSNLTQGQLFIEETVLSDTTNFSLSPALTNRTIEAGNFADINVVFNPAVVGPITGNLTIRSNDPDEPEFVIPISGTGVFAQPGGFADLADSMGVADAGASFGVAWADYDEDGDPDLYVAKSLEANKLYRNDGTTFTDISAASGVADAGDGSGAAWADYDGDSDLDLYVTNFGQPNRLFRNDGGTFTEVGAAAGVDDTGDGFGSAWADVDKDGDPDLYVANFGPNVFYRNLGNGTFEEIANDLGIADSSSGIQPVFADFDNDQDPDLFVANSGPNRFWWNNGDGTFTDASGAFVPPDAGPSTGAGVGDFNNDGLMDLYVTYFGENRLYQNQGGEGFTNVAFALGLGDSRNSRGAVWGDFDNDGWLDLFYTNRDTENKLFRNIDGNSQFEDVSAVFGVNTIADSRGVALADFDSDGSLDMFVAIQDSPDKLFRNQEATGNWLTVVPKGTMSSTDAIGARVTIVYDGINKAIREITGGTSFLSQDALSASFGIGEFDTVDTLSIRWPSGILQRFSQEDIGINRVLTIVEEDPFPPVEIQVVSTSTVLVANGSAQTDIDVSLLDQNGDITLVSGRSINFSLDIGGGDIEVSGPTILDGIASARFTAGTHAASVSLTVVVAGLPSKRIFIDLLTPLAGTDATIERIVGSGAGGFSGDGGPATDARLNLPRDVAQDANGNIYVADTGSNRIRRVSSGDSTITTFAGTGVVGNGPVNEGPAASENTSDPRGIAVHPDGSLLVSEGGGQRIQKIDLSTGITRGFAGSGFAGFSGEGGPATEANLTTPRGLAVGADGTAYIVSRNTASIGNNGTVQKVEGGIINTIAGDPLQFFASRDGVPATESRLTGANGVAVDGTGNVYIAEEAAHRIRRVDPSGIITTFAGNGSPGSGGDGGPAQFLQVNGPQDVAYDPSGILYISDSGNDRIVAIELATGLSQVVAGSGRSGSSGNQGNALEFSLDEPSGIGVAPDGTLLIADTQNNRVLRLAVQYQSVQPPVYPPPIDPGSGDETADFNGDGNVDFQDFLPFAEAFGTVNPAFDIDGDGQVGFSDFLRFANAFGRPTTSNPAYTGGQLSWN